jgi:hypothetical protein
MVKVPPETEFQTLCCLSVSARLLGTRAERPEGEGATWDSWKVSEPGQRSTALMSEEVRETNEGRVMLRGVAGLLIGAALALTVASGFPF